MSCGFIYAAANNKGMMLDNKKRQTKKDSIMNSLIYGATIVF